ncbi:MAG: glycosyltransferase family 4 protein [Phycisphaeraceae bacterium]|nr:glycosyltransferase family 4 protein [Phycisphaeraceae bacterium]
MHETKESDSAASRSAPPPLRVLHLITRFILGGAQENTLLSCRYQHEDGHEVILAHGPIYGPEGSLGRRADAAGFRREELPSMVRAVHPWKDRAAYRQCRKLIRKLKPDVVHTHSSKAGILGRAAAWAEKVPAVVHTIHGLPFHPYQNSLSRRLYIAAERWAARRCHRIVCVADAMARQALAAGVGRREQYLTVYSGMQIERFAEASDDRQRTRAELGLDDEDRVVGTVARLAELKGHDDLLEGLAALMKKNPRIKLLWVGDGWWRPRLEKRIASLNLSDRVKITGLVDPQEIPKMIRAMDLLVHPSYREGLARALPQALLCSVPVVSYDCDGASEVCLDGQTGRLVDTGDRGALAEAVEQMLEDPTSARAMAEAGRSLCLERFDARFMARRLIEVYRDVLHSQGGTA